MKHKHELAFYLAEVVSMVDPRLDSKYFYTLLVDYEENHEGQTILSKED